MLRFASRFLGFWLVAAALVAGVVDGAKSIAASSLVLTSVADTWGLIVAAAGSPSTMEPSSARWPLDLVLQFLLAAPTVVLFGALGAVFLILGARRRPPTLSREFAS
jgi:uncharacterized membrane protein (UPF0136 family)